ncbi:hypothetical protein G7K71_02875 [Desulfofundulus sp. TPOSR]|uniref:hypothetical protein n=1 Tax=Desulfofundulus sp. TPOSR TaxID=2714340 RepID=UPI001409C446|nr:hypothetical protein [Desulfofundulus sp. TPOSR]NHM25970.1 hypothetical protein [Desulfofundulus sp. TPOSR]
MPTHEQSRKWRVVVFPLYNPEEVMRLLRRISPLWNDEQSGMTPGQWWVPETYYTGRSMPKVVVVVFQVPVPDPVGLVNRAGALLERNHGMVLDWAGGLPPQHGERWKTYLVVKTKGYSVQTGRSAVFRVTKRDLADLQLLLPSRPRERTRERGR